MNPATAVTNPLIVEKVATQTVKKTEKGAELFRRGLIKQTDTPSIYEVRYTVNLSAYTCDCPDFTGKRCGHLRAASKSPWLLTPTADPNVFLLIYTVNLLDRTCTCPDFQKPCKHMHGAEMLEVVLRLIAGMVDDSEFEPTLFAA